MMPKKKDPDADFEPQGGERGLWLVAPDSPSDMIAAYWVGRAWQRLFAQRRKPLKPPEMMVNEPFSWLFSCKPNPIITGCNGLLHLFCIFCCLKSVCTLNPFSPVLNILSSNVMQSFLASPASCRSGERLRNTPATMCGDQLDAAVV